MEDVTREHLGWLIVWGNVFGKLRLNEVNHCRKVD